MVEPKDASGEQVLRLLALHKYFLNASYLRDVFMRRIKRGQPPTEVDVVTSMNDMIAMCLWYATVYAVIEGWRETKL